MDHSILKFQLPRLDSLVQSSRNINLTGIRLDGCGLDLSVLG
jgi:hypothetical protein